jgi:hypothetical protein
MASSRMALCVSDPGHAGPPADQCGRGLAVDKHGNIYGAEVGPRQLAKHVK